MLSANRWFRRFQWFRCVVLRDALGRHRFERSTRITDYSPLAACPTLEEIHLPAKADDLSELRKLPHPKLISTDNRLARSAAEFWREYDAQHAAKK
jgi:hypothetical protein